MDTVYVCSKEGRGKVDSRGRVNLRSQKRDYKAKNAQMAHDYYEYLSMQRRKFKEINSIIPYNL